MANIKENTLDKTLDLIKELEKHSEKTQEFKFLYENQMIIIRQNKDPYWILILLFLLVFCVPILMLFIDTNLFVKIGIALVWMIYMGKKFIRTAIKNKDLKIDIQNKNIELNTNSVLTKWFSSDTKYCFEDFKSIVIEKKEETNHQSMSSLIFYAVNAKTKNGDLTLCMFNDNFIAKRFAFLMRILID
ncbi:hypothetical protein GCQ56_18685 [Marinifilum sp. N1E240]|uniref:hypothetical protein n=1 Tax=Marinifilum sp. N1E240 TaxID=2608082 RepID=UPI00128CE27C|nr:hypothetical protein [Marinifilum sp. N1E240]MPQ49029.1 hypothetical protein [Marinifilum sp. N1E240]